MKKGPDGRRSSKGRGKIRKKVAMCDESWGLRLCDQLEFRNVYKNDEGWLLAGGAEDVQGFISGRSYLYAFIILNPITLQS